MQTYFKQLADAKTNDDGNVEHTYCDIYPPTDDVLNKMLDLDRQHSNNTRYRIG